MASMKLGKAIASVNFEIFGEVQGVFFRKYTKEMGEKLGLRGYCENTRHGTVRGSLEGLQENVEKMKEWLQTTGSPHSRISRAEFKDEKFVTNYQYNGFVIRR